MLRYDEFPNSIKFLLIQDDQLLLNENGIYLREIVNYTDHSPVSDSDIVASIGILLGRLLPDLDGAEATLIEQMKLGNNNFYSIADVYAAFRDVFIYKVPAQLEKRVYFSVKGGEVIDSKAVDEFIRQEEIKQLELAKRREEISLGYKIDAFEQKIENQTNYSVSIDTDGFENRELLLDDAATKQIPSEIDEFEIIRSVQPKTIDLNEVTSEITSSLQNIVDEFHKYGKQRLDDSSKPQGEDAQNENAAPTTEENIETNADSDKENSKQSRKSKKRRNKEKNKNKKLIETEKLESFADEALESIDSMKDEGLLKTTALDEIDKDSPFYIYRNFETSKLDAEDTSDLDEFYKTMDSFGNKNNKFKKIAYAAAVIIFLAATFTLSLLYFRALNQAIVPSFKISSPTLKTVQCENDSQGSLKIAKCVWRIYHDGQMLAESEGDTVSFSFENIGEYEIHMIIIDKEGNELEPVVKIHNYTHDVTEPSNQ